MRRGRGGYYTEERLPSGASNLSYKSELEKETVPPPAGQSLRFNSLSFGTTVRGAGGGGGKFHLHSHLAQVRTLKLLREGG